MATNLELDKLADTLQGTCMSLEAGLEQLGLGEELSVADAQYLDSLVFLCDGCSWWCEVGEANENPDGGGDLCDDCHEDEDD